MPLGTASLPVVGSPAVEHEAEEYEYRVWLSGSSNEIGAFHPEVHHGTRRPGCRTRHQGVGR
jgi:hypothetical protein